MVLWFRLDTETDIHIDQYFSANTVTDIETRFQRENLIANIKMMGL